MMMMIIIVFIIMTATIVIMEGKLIFVNKVQPLGELESGWWRGRKLHLQTEVFIILIPSRPMTLTFYTFSNLVKICKKICNIIFAHEMPPSPPQRLSRFVKAFL